MAAKAPSVVIDGSIDDVFNFVSAIENYERLHRQSTEHLVTKMLPGGGHNCVQVYNLCGGTIITGTSTCLAFDRPHRISNRGELDVGGAWVETMTFEQTARGTKVTLYAEIETPSRWTPTVAGLCQILGIIRHEFKKNQLER